MPRIDWTPEMDASLREWAAEIPPVSVSQQAQRLGLSKTSVNRRRAALAIESDHAGTQAATAAKTIDAAARRAALEHRHLDRLEHLFARLEAPTFTTILKGSFGVEETRVLDDVPPRDEKELTAAMTQHWGALERIQRMSPDRGASDAKSMLGGIAQLLEQAAASMPEDGPDATSPARQEG